MRLALALAVLALAPLPAAAEPGAAAGPLPTVRVYKSPTCGCCTAWEKHLEAAGFPVESVPTARLAEVKQTRGVPREAEACHTALVDGYVVEGHVPADDVKRLLRERPDVRGLAVPGMPLGSPGMESPTPEPYAVYSFDAAGSLRLFQRHEPAPTR